MTGTQAWLDLTSGVSGDMLLGACFDAGVPVEVVQDAIDGLNLPERVRITTEPATRSSIGGTRAIVTCAESHHHRRLGDIKELLAGLPEPVRSRAVAVFERLAAAEAHVHRMSVDDVHFHEVGALDAIADVVGVVTALDHLGISHLTVSPIALGGGRVDAAHGSIPIPGPAVLQLLSDSEATGFGGPIDVELATPTGVALAVTLADAFGAMPASSPDRVGVGCGGRDPDGHPNITRIVFGQPQDSRLPSEAAELIEANVDDLDPRLWPGVLSALMDSGASDAWLTPILMKKGRPAHTLTVLCAPDDADRLSRIVYTHTSSIGLRRTPTTKHPLPRETVTVEVRGHPIRVKVSRLDGEVITATPEYDDVARAALAVGLSEREIIALTQAQRDESAR